MRGFVVDVSQVSFWCFRITQNITLIGLFYKNWEVCGVVSDCEELVGVTHTNKCVTDLAKRIIDCILWLREIGRLAKGPLMLSQLFPHPC